MIVTYFPTRVTPVTKRGGLAATTLSPLVQPWQGYLIEAWITLLLVLIILGATNSRWKGQLFVPNIIIGFAVTCGILCAVRSAYAKLNSQSKHSPRKNPPPQQQRRLSSGKAISIPQCKQVCVVFLKTGLKL